VLQKKFLEYQDSETEVNADFADNADYGFLQKKLFHLSFFRKVFQFTKCESFVTDFALSLHDFWISSIFIKDHLSTHAQYFN